MFLGPKSPYNVESPEIRHRYNPYVFCPFDNAECTAGAETCASEKICLKAALRERLAGPPDASPEPPAVESATFLFPPAANAASRLPRPAPGRVYARMVGLALVGIAVVLLAARYGIPALADFLLVMGF